MTFRVGLRAVLITAIWTAGATTTVAAQAKVVIGAHVPGYCMVGAGRAVFDVPVVITVNETGDVSAQRPAVSEPGVICNCPALLRVVLSGLQPQSQGLKPGSCPEVRGAAEVHFGGATARLDLSGGASQQAQRER